ncbi:hypothetical protein [Micromonospora sp. WMMD736]|uniref:hypothetical protein n=1 Tax=Micromonospora sp. WMMD736 TaxID=3404112 RepID=UPI003B93AEEB
MNPSSDLTGPLPVASPLPVAADGGRAVESHSNRLPTRRTGPASSIRQVVTGLRFGPGPSRQECWRRLPRRVADRMIELAGDRIEWWAFCRGTGDTGGPDDNRPAAVLLGAAGVCFADPRLDAAYKPVYSVSCYQLDSGSLRQVAVVHRPEAAGVAFPGARQPAPPPPQVDVPGLDAWTADRLGNLPPEAQLLLRAPFTRDHPVLRGTFHYEGSDHQLDFFAIVLAGARHVTMATGTRVIPVGHNEHTAHWSLTCGRASVTRRIGR